RGRPPRWADEGAAIHAEDDEEQKRHEALARSLLNEGRALRLRELFQLSDYPRDAMVLFAQGYSVTHFLVERGGRRRFVAFLKDGLTDWDKAALAHYDFPNVEALETAWLASLERGGTSTAFRGAV